MSDFHIRVGFAGASHSKRREPPSSCLSGGFYKSPITGQTVDSSSPLNIVWDTACLSSKAVDIYLYAPSANQTHIQIWENVPFQKGSFQTTLKPKWWNATSSQSLQLNIVESGKQPFETSMPAGPIFTATYTAPTSGPIPADADITKPDSVVTNVGDQIAREKSFEAGKIAAAVLLPILFVVFGILAYLKITRTRAQAKSKKWTQDVDKRMSTISKDWKSLSGAGANAAIRHSMAHGPKNSSFSFGGIRPVGNGKPQGLYTHQNTDITQQMSQHRMSKVSFATDAHGISYADSRGPDGRRNVAPSNTNNPFVPPVPRLDVDSTQREGPLALTPEAIRARLAGVQGSRNSMDEVLPALAMMRTGLDKQDGEEDFRDDYLLWEAASPTSPVAPSIAPPAPVVTQPPIVKPVSARSSIMSPDEMLRVYAAKRSASTPSTPLTPATPYSPTPSTPDEMLRAYAERKANGGGPAFPLPAAMYNGNGVRTLYSPHMSTASAGSKSAGNEKRSSGGNNGKKLKKHKSLSGEDMLGATAV